MKARNFASYVWLAHKRLDLGLGACISIGELVEASHKLDYFVLNPLNAIK